MIEKSTICKAFIAIIAFGVLVGVEFTYRHKLFDFTFNFARGWQKMISGGEMKAWMYFSDTGVGTLQAIILLLALDFEQRWR